MDTPAGGDRSHRAWQAVGLGKGDRLDVAAVSPTAWWAWAYMAVVVSLGAFSAYAYALASLPVSTVATYAYVNPVIAVLLAVVLVVAAERERQGSLAPSTT